MFWFIYAWCIITISVSTLHVAYEDTCFSRFQLLVTGAELNELNLLYRQLFTPITFHNLQKDNIKIGGEHISMHSHRSWEFLHCSRKKKRNHYLNLLLTNLNHHTALFPEFGSCPCWEPSLSFAPSFPDSWCCAALAACWAKRWFLLALHLKYSTSREFVLIAIPNPVNEESKTARTGCTLNCMWSQVNSQHHTNTYLQ